MNPADPYGLVGQVLDGQFRVDKLVGEGGFSTVYRGHNVGLNEPVALKCLKLPAAIGTALVDTFIQRFRDESRILYRLSQGNLHIVRSLGAGTTQSPVTGALIPYMALEWLEGRSLAADFQVRRTTNKTGRPLDEVLRLFENAADALGFAHAQGIVHRDLNPGNLFLVSGPKGVTMKVLDFGVAKIMDDSLGLGPRQQTMGQFRIFAPAYGAPEQFDDRIGKVSAASDVYAFALILIEAMRDHAVNEGQHLGDFARLATDPARRPTPRFFGVELPDEVEKAFAKATTLDPNERWQSAAEMWKAITSANSFATEARYEAAARETPPLAGPGPKKQGTLPMTNKDLGRTMPLGTSGWAPPPKPGAAKPEFKPKLGNATTEPLADKSPAPAPPPRAAYAKTEPQKVFTTGDNAATDDEVGESTVVAPVPTSVREQAVPPPHELKAPPPKAAPQRTVALGDPSALKARDEALARARSVAKPLPAAGRPASVPKMPAPAPRPSTLAFGSSAPEPQTSATKTNPAPAPVADVSDVQDDPDAMFGDDGDPTGAQPAPVAKPDDVEEPPPSGRTLVMAPAPVRPPGSMMPSPAPPDVPPPPQRMLAGTQMLGTPPPMQASQPFGQQAPYGGAPNQPPPPQQQQAPMSPFARSALQPQGQPQQGGPWPPQQGGQSQLMPQPMQGGQSQMMPPHGQQPHMMQGQQGGQSQMMPPHGHQPHGQQGGQQAGQPFMPSPYAPRPSMDGGAPSTAQPGFEKPKNNPYLVIGIAFGAVAILGIGLSLAFIGRKPSGPQLASASASASAEPVPVVTASATVTPSATPSATAAIAVDAAIEEPADAAVASADAGTEAGAATTTDAATTATTAVATGVATNTTPPPNTAVAAPFTPPPTASSAKVVDPNAWNEGVARGKLNSANAVLVICKKDGAVSGPGTATVTFGVDGAVTSASVDPPYAGTKEGECALGQFRRVKVNAFNGSPQTLRHSFEVPK